MDISTIIIIIAQVLGIISWLLLLYSYTREDIDELLLVQIGVCAFDTVSYLLLGADAGLLICLVELIKTFLYYKTDKDKEIFIISIFIYLLIGLLTVRHWFAILPVLGSLIDSFGASRDTKTANVCSIVSNTLWTIYDILILSFVGAFNDIVVVLCNISVLFLGYSRIMHISKFRIVKYGYLTKKTIKKIYNLDVKTYGKENTWDLDYQKDVYKKNPDSLFVIKYKHEVAGYINYLNIIPEEFDRLKRVRKMPDKLDLDKIIPFKSNRKNYVIFESINVKKEYEKDQTVNMICRKIASFIKQKQRQRIYIHGILGYAMTEFEENVYISLGFKKIKELDERIKLYELESDDIKEIFLNEDNVRLFR